MWKYCKLKFYKKETFLSWNFTELRHYAEKVFESKLLSFLSLCRLFRYIFRKPHRRYNVWPFHYRDWNIGIEAGTRLRQ